MKKMLNCHTFSITLVENAQIVQILAAFCSKVEALDLNQSNICY